MPDLTHDVFELRDELGEARGIDDPGTCTKPSRWWSAICDSMVSSMRPEYVIRLDRLHNVSTTGADS